MGKKYLETKGNSLESSILGLWQEAAGTKKDEELSKKQKKLDVDGDGEIEGSDLAKLRKKGAKKEVKEGKMSQLHQMIKDKKSAEEIAKAMKLDVKTVKALMSNYNMEELDLDEGTKQVLAHGGKGQYKAVRDGSITKIMYKGKVVGTADFDRGADSFFVSMKGEKGQKSFDDAQAMVDYFAKNKITEEYDLAEGKKYEHGIGKVNSAFEIGTPEYRQHTQSITPGQEITDYQRFKVESMKEALAKVWGLDEAKKEEKDLTKKVKGSTMTMTGKKSDEIDTKPEIDKEK
jgi:hypothetical protein